jgi:hypothetical protein
MLLTICLVVILETYVLDGGLQVAFSQSYIVPKNELSLLGSVAFFHTTLYGNDNTMLVGKKSVINSKVNPHYPTMQEKVRIDKMLNQTLSLLPPIGRAINESHSCILEAVICGSGKMTNATMLKL